MASSSGATLHDLRQEDKLKIGNLLRELARAQRQGQQANLERTQYAERLKQMRSQNHLIVQETVKLRGKFRQSLNLLKTYQARLGDAASSQSKKEEAADQPVEEPQPQRRAAGITAKASVRDAIASTPAQAAANHNADGAAVAPMRTPEDEPTEAAPPEEAEATRLQVLETLRERFPRAAAAYESRLSREQNIVTGDTVTDRSASREAAEAAEAASAGMTTHPDRAADYPTAVAIRADPVQHRRQEELGPRSVPAPEPSLPTQYCTAHHPAESAPSAVEPSPMLTDQPTRRQLPDTKPAGGTRHLDDAGPKLTSTCSASISPAASRGASEGVTATAAPRAPSVAPPTPEVETRARPAAQPPPAGHVVVPARPSLSTFAAASGQTSQDRSATSGAPVHETVDRLGAGLTLSEPSSCRVPLPPRRGPRVPQPPPSPVPPLHGDARADAAPLHSPSWSIEQPPSLATRAAVRTQPQTNLSLASVMPPVTSAGVCPMAGIPQASLSSVLPHGVAPLPPSRAQGQRFRSTVDMEHTARPRRPKDIEGIYSPFGGMSAASLVEDSWMTHARPRPALPVSVGTATAGSFGSVRTSITSSSIATHSVGETDEMDELLDIISGVDSLHVAHGHHSAYGDAPRDPHIARGSRVSARNDGAATGTRGRVGNKQDPRGERRALASIGNGSRPSPSGRSKRPEWVSW